MVHILNNKRGISMADKILTFNGKTISGPSGTGIVIVKEPEPDSGFIDIGDNNIASTIRLVKNIT